MWDRRSGHHKCDRVVVMASGTQSGVTQGAEVEPRKVEQAEAPLLASNIDVLNRICGEG